MHLLLGTTIFEIGNEDEVIREAAGDMLGAILQFVRPEQVQQVIRERLFEDTWCCDGTKELASLVCGTTFGGNVYRTYSMLRGHNSSSTLMALNEVLQVNENPEFAQTAIQSFPRNLRRGIQEFLR